MTENTVSMQDLIEWDALQKELKLLKAKEMLIRKRLFALHFPTPTEGTNSVPLNAGWVLKGKYQIDRDVDVGALTTMAERLRAAKINVDKLVQYKPSLVLSEYRTLTAEEQHLFDQCLVVKPGSPSLEIVLPAKNKPK